MPDTLTTQEQQALNALLIEAVREQNLPRIQECVRKGADIHLKVKENESLYSFMTGNFFEEKICDYFLSLGVNVDTQDSGGWRPLARAVAGGNYGRTKYYLKKKANPMAQVSSGKTTLDVARELDGSQWRSEIIEALLAALPDRHRAPEAAPDKDSAAEGAQGITRRFQAAALSPDHQRILDDALFFAVGNADLEQITLCMQKGANIDARNGAGKTAIMVAVYEKEDAAMSLNLLKHKPDLLLKCDGKTVFDMVMKNQISGGMDKRKLLLNILLAALPDAGALPVEYRPAAKEKAPPPEPVPSPRKLPRDERGFHL